MEVLFRLLCTGWTGRISCSLWPCLHKVGFVMQQVVRYAMSEVRKSVAPLKGAGWPGTKTIPASHCYYTSQACVGVEGFRGLLSAPHIGTPPQSWLLCPGPACSRGPGSAQEDSPDVVLPPTWEALMELPTPGSGLAQPWLL